ncbi:MAG TPA: hypothetical protein VEL76_39335, partial [Gemmataceae bacterium]|nr:hypothetical protein [Gemmataceae bacterium]
MTHRRCLAVNLFVVVILATAPLVATQPNQAGQPPPDKKEFGKKDFFGKGGFGPGPMGQRRKLIPMFDKDGDGRLNDEERAAAREFIQKGGGKGGFPGFGKGGFGKGVFGPGNFLAKPFLEAVDTNKDGLLTKAELLAGIKK